MTTRYGNRADMTATEQSILNAWLVYHGINLAEARRLDFTGYGYMQVSYKTGPDRIVTLDLKIPPWL